jgi:hypothetical protein
MAAMAVSIGLAIYMQSMLHIAIGACVAPLLLLRTDESVAMGKQLFETLRPKPRETSDSDVVTTKGTKKYINELIRLVYLIPLSFYVRVYSTVFCSIKNPIGSIMSIRRNWIQSVFCTDIGHHPLELVPGTGKLSRVTWETYKKLLIDKTVNYGRSNITRFFVGFLPFSYLVLLTCYILRISGVVFAGLSMLIVLLPLFNIALILCGLFAAEISVFLCVLIAFSYRFNLKSTAFLWLPLLFIPSKDDSIEKHLKNERKSALARLSRSYSSLVIAFFIAKVFLLPQVIDWWNNLPTSKILNVWVMPEKLHQWHIAGAVGAGLNLVGFFFFYDQAPQKLRSGTWSETFVKNVAVSLKFVINSISIYTILVGIYLTWNAIDFVKFPEIDWNPFPWW